MTKAEREWQDAVRDMGCCVCLFCLGIPDTPCEIHHIVEGGKRLGEEQTIGICPIHHRQGTAEHPSRHSVNGKHGGKAIFEEKYRTEKDLLEITRIHLGFA